MRTLVWVYAVFLISSTLALAQSDQRPYAGRERSAIHPLSAQEAQELLTGQSMGLADVAERHHYPGPKPVLDLASQLHLSEMQRAATQKIYDHMHAEAVRLGRLVVDKERELDHLLAKDDVDSTTLDRMIREIAKLRGELRVVHLQAHVETTQLLSPEQIKKYGELRGNKASE